MLIENTRYFDEERLRHLTKDLNLIYDDDDDDDDQLIWFEGRLKNAPLAYEIKTPYLINTEPCLATMIDKHIHECLKLFHKANTS